MNRQEYKKLFGVANDIEDLNSTLYDMLAIQASAIIGTSKIAYQRKATDLACIRDEFMRQSALIVEEYIRRRQMIENC